MVIEGMMEYLSYRLVVCEIDKSSVGIMQT